MDVDFPEKLAFLFDPHRYKVIKGGRYGLKSWSAARALLMVMCKPDLLWPGRSEPVRVLCARETQKSIEESVHRLLTDQIKMLGFERFFTPQKSTISCANGGFFAFAGIRQNVHNLKSLEGFDICWVEEAEAVSRNSWNVLIPTIRRAASEIWITYNPQLESDETHQRFALDPPPDAIVVHTTWRDNPWLNDTIKGEIEYLRQRNPDDYENVYEGACRQAITGAVYAAELSAADREGRLTRIPYDPQQPVHTFWDLGFGDSTSIWFAQSFPFEFRLIDHISGSLQGLAYYTKQLQEKTYTYGNHWLPHDGKAHELGTGKSIQEQLGSIFGASRIQIAPRLALQDGIAAVRVVFPKCWFDREKCADGIQSLRHYRYEHDDDLGSFKRNPLHDWSSHDADAFRTFAVAIRQQKRPEDMETRPTFVSRPVAAGTAWMR